MNDSWSSTSSTSVMGNLGGCVVGSEPSVWLSLLVKCWDVLCLYCAHEARVWLIIVDNWLTDAAELQVSCGHKWNCFVSSSVCCLIKPLYYYCICLCSCLIILCNAADLSFSVYSMKQWRTKPGPQQRMKTSGYRSIRRSITRKDARCWLPR